MYCVRITVVSYCDQNRILMPAQTPVFPSQPASMSSGSFLRSPNGSAGSFNLTNGVILEVLNQKTSLPNHDDGSCALSSNSSRRLRSSSCFTSSEMTKCMVFPSSMMSTPSIVVFVVSSCSLIGHRSFREMPGSPSVLESNLSHSHYKAHLPIIPLTGQCFTSPFLPL